MECWMNVCKPENSPYETRNFSSSISSNMQKKSWMKCWAGLLRSLEVPFRYIISFFSRTKFQCMSSLVYTVYCQKSCSVKKGVLKDFVNFLGKHLCWSLFLIKFQAWHQFWKTSANDCFALHSSHTLLLIGFTLNSAPSSSSWVLLLLISPIFTFGSNSKGFKESKSGIAFSLKWK